jgi:FKBP-type peptidyl-prolyl cis-trans isomerase
MANVEEGCLQMDVCGDGSVIKFIFREGKGPLPQVGAKVTVNYRGRVADNADEDLSSEYRVSAALSNTWASDALMTYFDDSFARGQPLTLSFRVDPVIEGWTDLLGTMREGERSSAIVSPPKVRFTETSFKDVIFRSSRYLSAVSA